MGKDILVTLTPAESKRLIAKSIAAMPDVLEAKETGIVNLQLSTSCAYVYEELSGKTINRSNHICGQLHEAGGCSGYLAASIKREVYFEKGAEKYINFPNGDFPALFSRMTEKDILIKSGNILARDGKAGVFVGEPGGGGGEWGKACPFVKSGKFRLIAPMTLNKSVHADLSEVLREIDMDNLDYDRTHTIAGILPLPGLVVTEIDALRSLTGVTALQVAASGVGSGEGTVTLLLKGSESELSAAWELVTSIKGEPPLKTAVRCGECLAIKNHGICKAQVRIHRGAV